MRIKKGDLVKVISGGERVKGVTGKIATIDREKGRVTLENGPMNKRHLKPEKSRKHPEGGIIERPVSVHVSNVMPISEASDRPVRVGYEFKDKKKLRVARGKSSSGETL